MTNEPLQLFATTGFGLEAVVARELKALGYTDQRVSDGKVSFTADVLGICRTNLWLRSADRVFLQAGNFPADDFGQLFDGVHAVKWSQLLPRDAAFPVRGKSTRSKLHSVPDGQSIVKKAIVEQMKQAYHIDWFSETGSQYAVEFSIVNNQVTLGIDTSGAGLNRRGYRKLTMKAPLKETIAAAMVQLSYWNRERPFIDPLCGSGTLPIEAALIARNMAPGLNRRFAAEEWEWIDSKHWDAARGEARDLQLAKPEFQLIGTDIDKEVLKLARYHAKQAGVEEDIHFQQQALADFTTQRQYGCIITNPPYGERLGTTDEAETIYRLMGEKFQPLESWSKYVLTSHPNFEQLTSMKADRRRKIYNGKIACTYYQYAGPPPPRRSTDKNRK